MPIIFKMPHLLEDHWSEEADTYILELQRKMNDKMHRTNS
jgi:hypothetical protein